MLMASTRSYYVSMKFAFLNMSSGYVYRIDTFQPYVDKALFFKLCCRDMLMASTLSGYVSIEFAFLNILSRYA